MATNKIESKRQHRVNQTAYTLVIKQLMAEPSTLTDLENVTGLHRVTLQRLFRVFRRHKIVHITDWEQDSRGRDVFAVFALGEGKDKPKFRMTQKQIAQRYREKRKRQMMMAPVDALIKGDSYALRSL